MKSFIAAIALPALVVAHGPGAAHHHHARQATNAAAAAATTPAPGSNSAAAPTASLLSTESNAVPLASIVAGSPSIASVAYPTPTAGSVPTYMKGAPGLPDLSTWSEKQKSYPPADKIPPTDSAEVKQWLKDVAASGIKIPDISTNKAGGCGTNPEAAKAGSKDGNCWWTCSGCERETDVSVCPSKNTWGLTYDDGPSESTPMLLKYLDEKKLKATFYVIGSRAFYSPAMLQAEYINGHEIGVHTWSHFKPLTEMTNEEIVAELGWSKKLIKDIIGVTPNTWRPPFGDIDDRVRAISKAMGLTPVIWTRISQTETFDTEDFGVAGGVSTAPQVINSWQKIISHAKNIETGFIALEHDLFPQSVELAIGYILPDALAHKDPAFNIMPVAQCLGLPMENAYIELNNNSTNPPAASATAKPSGSVAGGQATGASAGGSGASGASPSGSGNAAGRVAILSAGSLIAAGTALVGGLVGFSLIA